ncbi:hypothetical protein NDU88_000088 [Pleurodeles waltl]|uniref:Uncharacterized protein n=1 Tax=Pleurodeles waltl TaxID=8319 RepID=A0AAV7S6S3_PLEWA|nr:hypothetical protein NDU88_000088 [Pleurodeles waltl]
MSRVGRASCHSRNALPVDSIPTALTNFECPRDLAAVVAKTGDSGCDPMPLAPLQADVDADGNGPLDTSNFAEGLSLAPLQLSAPSSTVEGQSILFEGRSRQLPQAPIPLGNEIFTQDPEVAQSDREATINALASADLRAPACTLDATRNSQ